MRIFALFFILTEIAFGYHHHRHLVKHPKGYVKKHNKRLHAEEPISFLKENVAFPNQYSLVPVISDAEDQGQCGSCWDFSLTNTLRDTYLAQGKKDPGRLSFMYLLNCAKDMYGCNGGDFDAAKHMINGFGPPLYKFQPYTASQSACKKGRVAATGLTYHMLGTYSGPTFKDIAYVISQLKRPLATEIAADDAFQNYDDGIYDDCSGKSIDHMVELVGYNCEGPCMFDTAGALPRGIGYYIVKNSWGTIWGEDGYFRIKATDKKGARCNAIATEALYYDLK